MAVFQRDPSKVEMLDKFIDADGLPFIGIMLKENDPFYW